MDLRVATRLQPDRKKYPIGLDNAENRAPTASVMHTKSDIQVRVSFASVDASILRATD
jgi:hypothetical protein